MKDNYTREEVVYLTNELEDRYIAGWDGGHFGIREQFLKDKGLIAPVLEIGKWYKWMEGSEDCLFFVTNDDGFKIKGFGFRGDRNIWVNKTTLYNKKYHEEAVSSLIQATDEEVKTALIKEAKRRGFKKGCIANNSNVRREIDGDKKK